MLLTDLLPLRDGAIDADEVEQIFKQLGHKCKRVRGAACTALTVVMLRLCTHYSVARAT